MSTLPPWLRIAGRGRAASGLAGAVSTGIDAATTASCWEKVAVVRGTSESTDITSNGAHVLDGATVYLGEFGGEGGLGTITAAPGGITFSIPTDQKRSIGIRVKDVFPDYELGMKVRGVVKFSEGMNLGGEGFGGEASGVFATAGVGYGIPNNNYYVAAVNYQNEGEEGSPELRILAAQDDGEVSAVGSALDIADQVLGIQGGHPGWEGFHKATSGIANADWKGLSAINGDIYTAETSLMPDGEGTNFDAADDQIFVYLRSGEDANLEGVIESITIYVLHED